MPRDASMPSPVYVRLSVCHATRSWILSYSDILTGTPLTEASNAGRVGRNGDSEPISGFIACCQRCDRLGAINTASPDRDKLWHLSLVKRLLMAGNDDEMFMTRSINVMPKKQNSSCKYVAYITNSERLNELDVLYYWRHRSLARPFCDSRATCVCQ